MQFAITDPDGNTVETSYRAGDSLWHFWLAGQEDPTLFKTAPISGGTTYADFSLTENAAGNVTPLEIGQVRATDPDESDTPVYRLRGGDSADFRIDPGNGRLTYVGTGADYETKTSYSMDVIAEVDGANSLSTASYKFGLVDYRQSNTLVNGFVITTKEAGEAGNNIRIKIEEWKGHGTNAGKVSITDQTDGTKLINVKYNIGATLNMVRDKLSTDTEIAKLVTVGAMQGNGSKTLDYQTGREADLFGGSGVVQSITVNVDDVSDNLPPIDNDPLDSPPLDIV